jgi:hypothetical protein
MFNKFTLFMFGMLFFTGEGIAQITTPYLYHSNSGNWNSNGIAADDYRGDLGIKSHRFTFQSSLSSPFDNFYKINNQSENNDNNFNSPSGSKVWSGALSSGAPGTIFAYGDGNGGANKFTAPNSSYMTLIWEDVNTSSNSQGIVMETSNAPVSVGTVSFSPADPQPGNSITITVNLSGTPSTQEKVYVRYSTNGFSSGYGTLLTAASGSSTATQTFTVPAQVNNTTVTYYAFTSTLSNGLLSGNSTLTDLATINYNNNSGSNFSFTVLPIELASFEATKFPKAISVKWTTLSERDNARFELERATDGKTWKLITSVASQSSNSNRRLDYTYTDHSPEIGKNYYRLRQIDLNGNFSISKVVSVDFSGRSSLRAWPNPLQGDLLNLDLDVASDVGMVQIFDLQGKLLREWAWDTADQNTFIADFSGLEGQMFFVKAGSETIKVQR